MLFDETKIKPSQKSDAKSPDFGSLVMTENKFEDLMRNVNDPDKYELIKQYYSFIIDQIFDKGNKNIFDFITGNMVNLDIFTKVISMYQITATERKNCNKLVYDYITNKEKKANIEVYNFEKNYYLALSRVINKQLISKLSVVVPEDLACILSVCKYSTDDTYKGVRKIISILIKQDINFITEQRLVDIFIRLYDHVTQLFEGVLSDKRDKTKLTDSENEIYSLIDLALLDILQNMPTEEIRKVLVSYDQSLKLGYINGYKFSMQSINPSDYNRVIATIDMLEMEGIYLP